MISPWSDRATAWAFLLAEGEDHDRSGPEDRATPIVRARRGTSASPPKSLAASAIVTGWRSTRRVGRAMARSTFKCSLGSLKPMCPFRPSPSSWRSSPSVGGDPAVELRGVLGREGLGDGAVEDVGPVRGEVDLAEEVPVHVRPVAPRVERAHRVVFVEVIGGHVQTERERSPLE